MGSAINHFTITLLSCMHVYAPTGLFRGGKDLWDGMFLLSKGINIIFNINLSYFIFLSCHESIFPCFLFICFVNVIYRSILFSHGPLRHNFGRELFILGYNIRRHRFACLAHRIFKTSKSDKRYWIWQCVRFRLVHIYCLHMVLALDISSNGLTNGILGSPLENFSDICSVKSIGHLNEELKCYVFGNGDFAQSRFEYGQSRTTIWKWECLLSSFGMEISSS